MDTLQEAIEILSIDSPNEEVDEFVICCAKTKVELDEAIALEDAGELDEEEADTEIGDILMEHSDKLMEIFDLEVEEVEPAEYSASNNIATFSESLGSVLAGAIAEEFENPVEGISRLAEATGSDAETIEGIIAGELVPDTVMGEQIAAELSSLQDEDTYKEWNGLVSRAYGEAMEDIEGLDRADENPRTEAAIATMAAQQSQLLAEFNQIKSQAQLGDEYRTLTNQASDMVEEGILTPFEQKELLGQFSDSEDGIALFSQACEATSVPPQVQLDRIKFYLHMKQRCGQLAMFGEATDGDEISSVQLSDSQADLVGEMLNEDLG